MRSFELKEHTADVAVEAHGDDLGETFAAVADGLTAAMCESVPDTGERFPVTVRAESREALLFEYLDDLIYERDVRNVLPAAHEARVEGDGEWVLEGSAQAVPLDAVVAREVKAVTYSEMRVEETSEGWEAYVVFDV
ncbi:archease [Halorarius litoreus]|uniref:archease n=1 Tax=Halorarius litoreus TaxID=2962676 RepID=UPI0020CFB842|nr:archease [Halorarius litoreus]